MFQILDGREHFYQWDIDRQIIVLDDDITEVHFCNRTDDCSLVCEVYSIDGVRLVNVPNILLQNDWRINVYAYDKNYTKHSECFKVVKRSKPTDYIYTETEIKRYGDLEERITALEENGIPSDVDLTGYATEKYVDNAIANIEIPEYEPVDLTGYATEEYVNSAIDNIEIPEYEPVDLTGYATEQYVDDAIENIDLPTGNASQYRRIATIETSGAWNITQDEDGNAFSLSHVFIRADLTAAENRSDGFLKFNGAAQLPWFFNAETSGYTATLEVMMVGDYLPMVYKKWTTTSKATSVENYCHNHKSSESAITSIQHYTAAYPHGSGSKYEIWGY